MKRQDPLGGSDQARAVRRGQTSMTEFTVRALLLGWSWR